MSRLGDINEYPRSIGFQLERLRMCSQFDVAQMFFAGGIDHANCSVAESNIKPLFHRVISKVVGIRLKVDQARRSIGFRVEEANSPVLATSDCNQFEILKKSNSLRFAETS